MLTNIVTSIAGTAPGNKNNSFRLQLYLVENVHTFNDQACID